MRHVSDAACLVMDSGIWCFVEGVAWNEGDLAGSSSLARGRCHVKNNGYCCWLVEPCDMQCKSSSIEFLSRVRGRQVPCRYRSSFIGAEWLRKGSWLIYRLVFWYIGLVFALYGRDLVGGGFSVGVGGYVVSWWCCFAFLISFCFSGSGVEMHRVV